MVILLAGDSHTGKTNLERWHYPYLSIDHLKMSLIRTRLIRLQAESSDAALTAELWPVVREIIKTCIENEQNLIVEGVYIPFGWELDFSAYYRRSVRYICLIFSEEYILTAQSDIKKYANIIEARQQQELDVAGMLKTNRYNLEQCRQRGYKYLLIDKHYYIDDKMLQDLLD